MVSQTSNNTNETGHQMNKQEQYWSLNGSFGMLAYCAEMIQTGKVTSLQEMREHLLIGMEGIHKEMEKLQTEVPELQKVENTH